MKDVVDNETNNTIKYLRTDNGSEFTSLELEQCGKDEGIVRHKFIVYNPQ